MDTVQNTERRHAGWLEHQRREAADRAALEEAARRQAVVNVHRATAELLHDLAGVMLDGQDAAILHAAASNLGEVQS